MPVFNLTVAETPEYFANGILAHNCAAARYGVTSRPGPSKNEEPEVEDPRRRLLQETKKREAAKTGGSRSLVDV